MKFPKIIPHSDGAGVIDAVGEGVERSRIAERVWLFNAQWQRPFGTAAEYVALPSSQAVRLPDNTSFAEGACLGIPAMTAHRCVFSDGSVAGQTLLIVGGAGVVGSYAIQLARWGGATVITTISSPEKAERARQAGANHILNYKTEDIAGNIADITEERGVDRIIDVAFGTNLFTDIAVLRENGVIATYGSDSSHNPCIPFYSLLNGGVTVRFVFVYTLPRLARHDAISDIQSCLEGGWLRQMISRRFPLAAIVAAHEEVENGSGPGKVLIDLNRD
jgi:NADPH2:quinone reductase